MEIFTFIILLKRRNTFVFQMCAIERDESIAANSSNDSRKKTKMSKLGLSKLNRDTNLLRII